jgi:hypothetical protein
LRYEVLSDLIIILYERWVKIIYYDDKPVGHIVIGWDESYNCYGVTIFVLGEKGLGEAIVYMKDFLKKGGKSLNVKIIDVHERSLYVVSEDGNWWCTDAADSSNPQMYSKKIWSFEEIKDGLNNRPKEILNYFDEMQKDPEHIPLGGSLYKPLYEIATEKKEKIKNVLVATLLLLITAIFVTGVNLFSKYKKGVAIK